MRTIRWIIRMSAVVSVVILAAATLPVWAHEDEATGTKLGDIRDGSRSHPVHVIPLRGEEDPKTALTPKDDPLVPFSTRQTCGSCHSYDIIAQGWHFNAQLHNSDDGFKGEPWIVSDALTATQIPVSYRKWPGVFSPEDLGLTRWNFVQQFGTHHPGGIAEDPCAEPDMNARWLESGEFEINCLICHSADPAFDDAEYATQIKNENYRWATTGSCGFAAVKGSAKKMPAMFDYLMPDTNDPKVAAQVPTVWYDESRFREDNSVFVDIVREVPNERCYYCHSTTDTQQGGYNCWKEDEDIHLKAGMTCVDCHRNGLDHMINRGREGDVTEEQDRAPLTCEGCHLGNGDMHKPVAGRLSAPRPEHKGIPTIHFEKLACTACHSGPWPGAEPHRVKLSRAHELGIHGTNKAQEALPHIMMSIFTERQDGKIAPHKMFWPAYWAYLKDGKLQPLMPETVKAAAEKSFPSIKDNLAALKAGSWARWTDEQVVAVLKDLGQAKVKEGTPVYVSGGKVYHLDKSGQLLAEANLMARPFYWPIAHNVRPASQSLGVGGAVGCGHCHSANSPFFFGKIPVDTALVTQADRSVEMVDLQKTVSAGLIKAFNASFIFRPYMKFTIILAAAVITGFLLLFGLRGLEQIARSCRGKDSGN